MSPSLNKGAPTLRVANLRHQYDGKPVLSIDAWCLMPSEHQFLLGPSGSGKTTFLRIVSGLLHPTVGSVELLGATITNMSVSELSSLRARHIGFVFQDHNLVSSLTVKDNMNLARHLANLPEDRAWQDQLLGALDLEPYSDTKPTSLSQLSIGWRKNFSRKN